MSDKKLCDEMATPLNDEQQIATQKRWLRDEGAQNVADRINDIFERHVIAAADGVSVADGAG